MFCALNQTFSDYCPLPVTYNEETPSSVGMAAWGVGATVLSVALYCGKRFYEEWTFGRLSDQGLGKLRQQKTRTDAKRVYEEVKKSIADFSTSHPRFKDRAVQETQKISDFYLLALCHSRQNNPQKAQQARLEQEVEAAHKALHPKGGGINWAARERHKEAQAALLASVSLPNDTFIANF